MYICKDCGATFEAPEYITNYTVDTTADTDTYTAYGDDEPMVRQQCPACHGDRFTNTPVCCECGQHVFGEFAELKNGEIYCSDCYAVYNIMD